MSMNNRFFNNKTTEDYFPERNQETDLRQQIRICQRMKAEAVAENNIYKWRKFEAKESAARTILYNIK